MENCSISKTSLQYTARGCERKQIQAHVCKNCKVRLSRFLELLHAYAVWQDVKTTPVQKHFLFPFLTQFQLNQNVKRAHFRLYCTCEIKKSKPEVLLDPVLFTSFKTAYCASLLDRIRICVYRHETSQSLTYIRTKGRVQHVGLQSLEVDIAENGMLFHFGRSITSTPQTLLRIFT